MARRFRYEPDGRVLKDFFADRSAVSIIQGPIGSGTSTACLFKCWRISTEQDPAPDGVRRSRWVVVRNTFSELKDTTLKTWSMWFEEKVAGAYGSLQMTRPFRHTIEVPHPDGKTQVKAEFIFLALDVDEDVRRLMSFEPTGFFLNEMQFIPKAIFDEAQSRAALGRYPPLIDGGPRWCGVIGDLNAPTEGHWIPYMRGDVPLPEDMLEDDRKQFEKPDDWTFFVQPPGLLEVKERRGKVARVVGYKENPDAENRKWLSQSYLDVIKGKPKEWIDARVMNRVGLYRAGKAVHESFHKETHVAEHPIRYNPELPLLVGLDFARNPAAIFGQVLRGQLMIIGEWGEENMSAPVYAPLFKLAMSKVAPRTPSGVQFFGDPTGDSMGQGTDDTPYRIFGNHGMSVIKAPGGNSIALRLSAVDGLLSSLAPSGGPALIISPTCTRYIHALGGDYHYRKLQGQTRYATDPEKNRSADYADAGQYLALGAGFGRAVVEQPQELRRQKPGTRTRRFSLKRMKT